MISHPVQLAIIGAAHGTKGEVKVKTFTAAPLDLAAYGSLYDKDGKQFEIDDIRIQKNTVIVSFLGVTDRNAAESLKGTELYVERDQLPDDLDEDEFYHTDLIGLTVKDELGQKIGTVHALFDFGGGDLLELKLIKQKMVLIPFSKAAVPEIKIEEGFIVIDSIAAGLKEDQDAENDDDEKNELSCMCLDTIS